MTSQKSDKLRLFFNNDRDISYFFLKKKEKVSMVYLPKIEKKVFLSEASNNNNKDMLDLVCYFGLK